MPAFLFYPRYFGETVVKYWRFASYVPRILRMQKRMEKCPDPLLHRDLAISPVIDPEDETLEMFELNKSSKVAVEKARRQADRRKVDPRATEQGRAPASAEVLGGL